MKRLMMVAVLGTGMLLAPLAQGSAVMRSVYPGQEDSLAGAVWSENRLWLLSDGAQLFSFSETETLPRLEYAGGPVVDMCLRDGTLHAVTEVDGGAKPDWVLQHRQGGEWVVDATLPVPGDYKDYTDHDSLIAMACESDQILLLTTNRLVTVRGQVTSEVKVDKPVQGGVMAAVVLADDIYIGFNHGEWGGGMIAINRVSGVVRPIQEDGSRRGGSKDAHRGWLKEDSDPVNGLIESPWKPGCVVVAIGLVHFFPHGRIVEVCGDEVRRIYFRNADLEDNAPEGPGAEAFGTVAFFGVMADADHVLAAGYDGLYRIDVDGQAERLPDVKYRQVGPFRVNFDNPDLVLILNSANGRHSLSGMTPMLVKR